MFVRRSRTLVTVCALLVAMASASIAGSMRVRAADPAALDTAVQAGPWEMRLLEALTGDDAAAAVAGASGLNPASPGDGLQFVAARISVTNASTASYGVEPDDFAVSGADGIVRRSLVVVPPSPALSGRLAPGAALEGWVVGAAPAGDEGIVLLYDSASISGTWADASFAVSPGATIGVDGKRAAKTNKAGRKGEAVGVDEVVATREWAVSLQEVVVGPAVYDISPEGTQRLADNYRADNYAICLDTWVALHFRIANNGGDGIARYLSPTAFRVADADGQPVSDVRFLSAPLPEAAGEYLPGAERSGWVAFELPSTCAGDEVGLLTDSTVVRFLPFADSRDARYIDWSNGATGAALPADGPPAAVLAEGDRAAVAEDVVNLRASPSTDADVVTELERDDVVVVTGPAEEAGGLTWYPVRVEESGETGYVSGAYLEAAS